MGWDDGTGNTWDELKWDRILIVLERRECEGRGRQSHIKALNASRYV